MRLLVLSNLYPPHAVGGYELICGDVVDRLRERGHRVAVLTSRFRRPDVTDAQEPDVRRELDLYWDGSRPLAPSAARTLMIELGNQRRLRRALAELKPDVVSVWAMGALSLGLLSKLVEGRRPLVFLIADDWLFYGPDSDPWTRALDRRPRLARAVRLARLASGPPRDLGERGAFCFTSDYLRRRAQEHTPWDFPLSTVVYGGIDTRDFPVRRDERERPWAWRLLFVGRLREDKGVETAVRALAALPAAATLDLVGYGSEDWRGRLERLARELGVHERVRFSVSPRSELRDRYLAADALLFPSEPEGFGLVPLEAMACGTPVAATAAGGSGEFLFDGVNCLRFAPGDAAGLARALERLAGDEQLRRRLVAAGRRTAAQLTADALTDELEAWLSAAAERFAHGPPPDRQRILPPG